MQQYTSKWFALAPRLSLAAMVAAALAAPLAAGCGVEDPIEPWQIEDIDEATGLAIRIPEFEIPPGRESQNCYFMQVPDLNNGEDIWIDRVLMGINPGSHHMNVFRVRTEINLRATDGVPVMLGKYQGTLVEGSDEYLTHPCWDSANWADWPLVANSQEAYLDRPATDWKLPDQVALKFRPGEMLMIQTHYVNTADQPAKFGARVGINMYKYVDPRPPIEMGTLFATQQAIRICRSQPEVTFSGTCKIPNNATVAAANGHFHKRGVTFSVFPWDGSSTSHPSMDSRFYYSDSWDHPPMEQDLSVPVPASGGIWWDCQYRWHQPNLLSCDDVNAKDPLGDNDCCYTDGGNTDVGEHCNVFLYYYPKGDSDVFCI